MRKIAKYIIKTKWYVRGGKPRKIQPERRWWIPTVKIIGSDPPTRRDIINGLLEKGLDPKKVNYYRVQIIYEGQANLGKMSGVKKLF